MHILIITQYFWPENFRINDLALGMLERGHKITVLTGMPNYPSGKIFEGYGIFFPAKENYRGIKIIRTPIVSRGKSRGLRLFLNFFSFVFSASLFAPFRCREKYDLIFVYEPSPITQCLPAIFLKMLKRIPVVLYVQDLWPESLKATGAIKSDRALKLVGKMVRFIYSRCDRILVPSKGFVEKVVAMGADKNKIHYLPNAAEDLYKPVKVADNAPERTQIPRGFCVMFAGNVGAAQDFPTILAVAQKLQKYSDIHFVVLGDGRMLPWVSDQVKTKKISPTVHLLGRHPVEKMPVYFALADVLLVTLKDEPIFALTIPAKVQSYMACEKPIVAALNGEGARVINESASGLVADARDVTGLANIILEMYKKDKVTRDNMGKNGGQYYANNFDRKMLLNNLEDWLQDWIKEKK